MRTSGPATNYSLSRGSLGWSHTREPRADLDLLLTLELGEWPEAAGRWAASCKLFRDPVQAQEVLPAAHGGPGTLPGGLSHKGGGEGLCSHYLI